MFPFSIGLCGNFNGMEGDDFKTTSGLVEATGTAFANTWKAQSICADQAERLEDPCSLSIESGKHTNKSDVWLLPGRAVFAVYYCSRHVGVALWR